MIDTNTIAKAIMSTEPSDILWIFIIYLIYYQNFNDKTKNETASG